MNEWINEKNTLRDNISKRSYNALLSTILILTAIVMAPVIKILIQELLNDSDFLIMIVLLFAGIMMPIKKNR